MAAVAWRWSRRCARARRGAGGLARRRRPADVARRRAAVARRPRRRAGRPSWERAAAAGRADALLGDVPTPRSASGASTMRRRHRPASGGSTARTRTLHSPPPRTAWRADPRAERRAREETEREAPADGPVSHAAVARDPVRRLRRRLLRAGRDDPRAGGPRPARHDGGLRPPGRASCAGSTRRRTCSATSLAGADPAETRVEALDDGDAIGPKEVVLRIRARYRQFGLYETAILGMLAQSTGWATAARGVRRGRGAGRRSSRSGRATSTPTSPTSSTTPRSSAAASARRRRPGRGWPVSTRRARCPIRSS